MDCPGRLKKSDSMDSMLGDSLLDPPQSLSRMPPRRYQSPSRCGSPSLEAPDHLLGGRSKEKPPPPSYDQAIRLREESPDLSRLNRHDLMRRRDMNLFLGLHPRLLHGPPRLSLPPKPTSTATSTRPTPTIPSRPIPAAIPCRAQTCTKPPLEPFSDRVPNYCTISGKHICDFEELDDVPGSPAAQGPSCAAGSGSPTGDDYKQAELGAKAKGWSARFTRTSTPYSRDSSSDSSQEIGRLNKAGSSSSSYKKEDLTQAEMEEVLFNLRSRVSPPSSSISSKEQQRRPSLETEDQPFFLHPKSRRSSIDELLEPQPGWRIPPQIAQVYRTELARSPSPLEHNKSNISSHNTNNSSSSHNNSSSKQLPSLSSRLKDSKPLLLRPLDDQLDQHAVEVKEEENQDKEEENIGESRADILLGAILKHRSPPPTAIHSVRDTSSSTAYSSSNSTSSELSPLTPDTPTAASQQQQQQQSVDYNVVDLCQALQAKCLISKEGTTTTTNDSKDKENDPNGQNGSVRVRSYSEASSPFTRFAFGSPRSSVLQTLEPLDMSFESEFDDNLSFSRESFDLSTESINEGYGYGPESERSRCEKRRSSIDEDYTVPSANKKAAFRKSFDSATSMVFPGRKGLPLTSSPAPLRRGGGIKFDFDSRISTPKDIKRALFESASPEEDSGLGVQTPKKKKQDPRRLLSTSAPATIAGKNNLLGNFEESVLNGRLEPVSTVEGFTAEIGASGTFHPKHLTFPVTVFFYTLCENSNIASPYLGHINLGKKGYRVPEKGTIQLTLFNPLGTVVKMFVVMYDLSDMPPNSQTFLRQRTLYMPSEELDNQHQDNRKWLRYLIHLRLMSSKSGKIYLHTDVRMIIFRKSDVDTASDFQQGKGFELRSFTSGPKNPKFSPRK